MIRFNSHYGLYVHFALWVERSRQQDYEGAYLEMLNSRMPSVLWESHMKPATYGHLAKYEEGKRTLENLLLLKPDFLSRGRELIRHYIKFDEPTEHILEGLIKVGLKQDA